MKDKYNDDEFNDKDFDEEENDQLIGSDKEDTILPEVSKRAKGRTLPSPF